MGADAVLSGRAGHLIRRHKSGNDNEKREHKASLRVVLRLSLQSEDETNDLLKSGPALAGPAGPPTPPLLKCDTMGDSLHSGSAMRCHHKWCVCIKGTQ